MGKAEAKAAKQKADRANPQVNAQQDAMNEALAMEMYEQGRMLVDMPGLAASDAVLSNQTIHHNLFICQPQQRNTAGRVFGGFMMRQAYRLAFSTAYMFAGQHPHFLEVDEINFLRPVDVGDLVNLS